MRPWIAMAAAFALALQMLLGGVLFARAEAAGALSGNPFEICLSGGDAGQLDHRNTDKAPAKHLQCVLCTLAKLSHAVVPAGDAAPLDVRPLAAVIFPIAEHVAQFHSPTGHYQRGPPAA